MRHLIDPADFTLEETLSLMDLADRIHDDPAAYKDVAARKRLATLFYEPSTRTRLSFEAAMLNLGGQVLGFPDAGVSSASKGETVADTIRVISCVADIAAMRHWRNPQGVQTSFLSAEEVENLTIRSGTLNQAERDTINYHIVATIKMLETLPWPRHLQNVPEYAGGHHERMDGKGYPRGLTREQMSLQARMMGIADIFEALTAADRPYKSGMTLSQAIAIMCKMRDNGHIDPDLFEVFVRERVYLRYGEQFLEAGQVDAVDMTAMGF